MTVLRFVGGLPRRNLGTDNALFITALFGLSLLTQVVQVRVSVQPECIPCAESFQVAKSLATTGSFADPYPILRTGPTAHVAPLWPMYVAVLYKAFDGNGPLIWMATIATSAIAWALCLYGAVIISRDLFGAEMPGIIASILGVLPLIPTTTIWEATPAAAALVWTVIAIKRYGAVRSGIVLGCLALLHPVAAVAGVVYYVVTRKPTLVQATTVAALSLAVVLPWTVRNYLVLGQVVPIRDNLGLEMKLAFNDHTQIASTNEMARMLHPSQSVVEAKRVLELGEGGYMRDCGADALRWILLHPTSAANSTWQRLVLWWMPYGLVPYPLLTCSICGLGILGILLAYDRLRSLFLAALTFSVPYYFVPAIWRYAVPTFWILLLGAGYAVVTIVTLVSTVLVGRTSDKLGHGPQTDSENTTPVQSQR